MKCSLKFLWKVVNPHNASFDQHYSPFPLQKPIFLSVLMSCVRLVKLVMLLNSSGGPAFQPYVTTCALISCLCRLLPLRCLMSSLKQTLTIQLPDQLLNQETKRTRAFTPWMFS